MKEGRRIIIELKEVNPWTFTSSITALRSSWLLPAGKQPEQKHSSEGYGLGRCERGSTGTP